MSSPVPMSQQAYKAHLAYCDANPHWSKLALAAVNRWGSGQVTLTQAIGEALEKAYEDGINGVEFAPRAPTVSKIVRRRK